MFKASDYRISPFELESVLIEHPAVAEAAVVPAPDELRLAVPKAYVVLVGGHEPSHELAADILRHARENLAPYKRIRRLQFADLPKTISGKIRRVELRDAGSGTGRRSAGGRVPRGGLRALTSSPTLAGDQARRLLGIQRHIRGPNESELHGLARQDGLGQPVSRRSHAVPGE